MTADDFLTRCYEVGVAQLDRIQIDCLMRVLGKPEISNAIKLIDLETLMSNFGPPSSREYEQEQPDEDENAAEYEEKKSTGDENQDQDEPQPQPPKQPR